MNTSHLERHGERVDELARLAKASSIMGAAPAATIPPEAPFAPVAPILIEAGTVDQNREVIKNAARLAPSWLLSFSFHLVALLSLALYGMSGRFQETISLSAQAVSQANLSDDIRVDFSDLAPSRADSAAPGIEPTKFLSEPLRELADAPVDLDGKTAVYAKWEDVLGGNQFSGVGVDGVAQHLMALESSAGEAGEKDANFFGLSARGSRFVFVLDCSGSMSGMRWEVMVNEVMNSIRSLDEGSMFLVILYSSRAWAMFDTMPRDTILIPAHKENVDRFAVWLSRQRPNGGTLPMEAMGVALRMNPDAIFLLSDGEFQDDTAGFLRANNVVRASSKNEMKQIPIHTIALDFTLGALTLQQIAGENKGQYRLITTE
ncbi:MAG: VWA domain-containing protein [Pirellulaceae bacterium]|jgi:hypothetical protein|nr:VWA domain-containing protein [Pirellulaceae bacterium]